MKKQRIIEFRGMTLNGDWVYGLPSHLRQEVIETFRADVGWYISNSVGRPLAYRIRPETLGQFTSKYDRNQKGIYEGDILAMDKLQFVVAWGVESACFELLPYNSGSMCYMPYHSELCEVIGNVHETDKIKADIA